MKQCSTRNKIQCSTLLERMLSDNNGLRRLGNKIRFWSINVLDGKLTVKEVEASFNQSIKDIFSQEATQLSENELKEVCWEALEITREFGIN